MNEASLPCGAERGTKLRSTPQRRNLRNPELDRNLISVLRHQIWGRRFPIAKLLLLLQRSGTHDLF
jgi:hypothetical protein